MIRYHIEGGPVWMIPLSVIFVIIIGMVVSLAVTLIQRKPMPDSRLEMVRQLGLLALVWGVFSTVVGFYQAFDSLSKIDPPLPLEIIMGGLRVALITANYGMIIFLVALLAHLILKQVAKSQPHQR